MAGGMVEWQKWLHTYYLRYTHTDDDDNDFFNLLDNRLSDKALIMSDLDQTRPDWSSILSAIALISVILAIGG
jgi:hypothetical protein